ncbi:MAG: cytochrome b N-terminal domain-containing protein [Alphaproteobacteria bacterium]|nr:cytochrome b N-terminal domain-containing protein [Alphaproteobacteria bacterium]
MSGPKEKDKFDNKTVQWINDRLPIFTMMGKEYGQFQVPKNFNYFWNFGAIAMIMLGIMIVTGVFMAMNYVPSATDAFASIQHTEREVNYGWLLRYMHMNGASFFFIAVYIHIFRGLYYGSYKKPRELVWIFGVLLMLLMMATAFLGYTLPWSQMSGWGATVITNLFSAIPLFGGGIVTWLWGGFSVGQPTLNRFYALHFLLPFIICAVVFIHVWALHVSGSNNPAGVEPKSGKDTVPFHPYYTAKDSFGTVVFMTIYFAVVFFAPLILANPDHFKPFNPLQTPPEIVPEWYFLPFYAMLRSFTVGIKILGVTLISAKQQGVAAMFGSILILFFLPWLDKSPVRSARFRPVFKWALRLLVLNMVMLTYAGGLPAAGMALVMGRVGAAYYYFFFLVLLPYLGKNEKTLPLPESISEDYAACHPVIGGAKKALLPLALGLTMALAPHHAQAAEGTPPLPKISWPEQGIFGHYDKAALQRGFQIYRQVCSNCHSMKYVYYRNLEELGYTPDQVKALAATYQITDGPNENGQMYQRPGRPTDRLKAPFANPEQARAALNGALPPDMSNLVNAREGGPDYIYAILTGYEPAPNGFDLMAGHMYNKYFPGHQIAMPQPLTAGQVQFEDGTPNSLDNEARDVAQFLDWASNPHMEQRKQMGLKVILFMLAFAGILLATKRKVWSDVT